jgi:hypothetical protein
MRPGLKTSGMRIGRTESSNKRILKIEGDVL